MSHERKNQNVATRGGQEETDRRTTSGRQREEHPRERDRQHSSPTKANRHGERHTLLPLSEREDFRRIAVRYRAFAWGVERRKHEDEERDGTETRGADVSVDQEAETGG